jgi:hypothetical protein
MENKIVGKKNVQKIFLGVMLMLFGAVLLTAQWVDSGVLILAVPGVTMLLWGCISREAGWIIPGSIVSSIAAGSIVLLNTPVNNLPENNQAAFFMLVFACGWFLITLLTRIFTGKAHFWALIPGSIMAVIGGLLLAGNKGMQILEYGNYFWALALVLVGISILVRSVRQK